MLRVGDRVKCSCTGSWVDGKVGTILSLNVVSSDGVCGHEVRIGSGITVLEPEYMELVDC